MASRVDGILQEVLVRACDEAGTMRQNPKALEPACLREQPVWGLDAFTRMSIRLTLEDSDEFRPYLWTKEDTPPSEQAATPQSPDLPNTMDTPLPQSHGRQEISSLDAHPRVHQSNG